MPAGQVDCRCVLAWTEADWDATMRGRDLDDIVSQRARLSGKPGRALFTLKGWHTIQPRATPWVTGEPPLI